MIASIGGGERLRRGGGILPRWGWRRGARRRAHSGAGRRRSGGETGAARGGLEPRPRTSARAGISPRRARCRARSGRGGRAKETRQGEGEREESREAGRETSPLDRDAQLATNDVMRGSRMMEATARDAPVLKKLAGVKATGRKLKKPMVHYSLSWAPDERPIQWTMRQAVDGSLKALGLENRQALVVAHGDRAHPHVHVIVNRVDPETGKAANMGRDRIKLSKWAEGYEREQGRIRCHQRQANNYRRARGEWVRGKGKSKGRDRRARGVRMPRETKASDPDRISQVAWWRAEERTHRERGLKEREKAVGELEPRQRQDWREVYQHHQEQRDKQAKACRSVWGRLRTWNAEGRRGAELGGAIRGRAEVLERWERSLEQRQQQDRVRVAQGHTAAVREIEHRIGKEYREELQGADERARLAARTRGYGHGYNYKVDELRGREWVDREEVEQHRELYGGPTYEQVLKERAERSARFEQSIRERARERPREPERSRDRDDGPSR